MDKRMYSYLSKTHNCRIFADERNFPIVLPCFYSEFISSHNQDYNLSTSKSEGLINELRPELRDLSEKVVELYLVKITNFLEWLEVYSITSNFVTLAQHHTIPSEIINDYLNNYLIKEKGKGEKAAAQHLGALKSYFTYLEVTGFTSRKNIYIFPKNKEHARMNTKVRAVIKYLTPNLRNSLTRIAKSKRDALLLRTAAECGLRSLENQGLLLNDFRVGGIQKKGLKTLFKEMRKDENKMEFVYYLQGIYSKGSYGRGGKSREIFISRDLLQSMEEYWVDERPQSASSYFFLNNSVNNIEPISKSRGTKVFAKLRVIAIEERSENGLNPNDQALDKGHTYHHLRHSFGTDLFYDLAEENQIMVDDVSTTSQVYITVAKVLGHSVTSKYGPQTTKQYIRSCHIKKQFEITARDYF